MNKDNVIYYQQHGWLTGATDFQFFTALDFKTDAALRSALSKKVGNSTVLLVTQRVATAKNSDQILVLDKGRIVGIGTHRELMQTCPVYQEIASSQLSKEELE